MLLQVTIHDHGKQIMTLNFNYTDHFWENLLIVFVISQTQLEVADIQSLYHVSKDLV